MNERRAWLSIVWHLKGALNGASWRHVSVIGLIAFWGLVVGIIDYPLYVETRQLASQVKTRNAMNSKSHRAAIKKDTPRDI
ncbi:MAG TPA: hypothetical protein VJQ54_07170, partial [Candidatus Sulfotelmatobacter sp.]|nr:hypothetical protein [Candidatus Sulfotelmatobacter sp.]